LLDGLATDDAVAQSVGKLLNVRQVAKLLGMCPATIYMSFAKTRSVNKAACEAG
jgi:predicted DNA-binding transcriptional regulator AlpA